MVRTQNPAVVRVDITRVQVAILVVEVHQGEMAVEVGGTIPMGIMVDTTTIRMDSIQVGREGVCSVGVWGCVLWVWVCVGVCGCGCVVGECVCWVCV